MAPDPAMGFLLDGPPAAAIDPFFPNLHENPGSQQQELMQNYRWAVRAVVYELFVIASGEKSSLLGLMESDPLFKVKIEPPRGGRRGRGYSSSRGGSKDKKEGRKKLKTGELVEKEGVDGWKSQRERAQERRERRDGAENKGVETSSRRNGRGRGK